MSDSSKVWIRFCGRNGDLKLRIMDTPEHRVTEAVDLYIGHYLAGETIIKAAGIARSQEAIAEYRLIATEKLAKDSASRMMICCEENDDDTIGKVVGVAFSYLSTVENPFDLTIEPTTKELKKFLEMSISMLSSYQTLEEQKVDKYFEGLGIIVHPDYRRMGIAREFLKARRLMCKEEGVPVTAAWMTSAWTQAAAERDGYETKYELNYEEFGKLHNVTFEYAPKFCKYMMAKVQ